MILSGVRGGTLGWGTALQTGRTRVRFLMRILNIFINIIFLAALGSTQPLRDMSTRIFPGGKDGGCVMLTTLLPACAFYLEIKSLNLLEPFTEIALPCILNCI